MATLKLKFINRINPDYNVNIIVVGKKMPKSWVHKNYGADCDDEYYFVEKRKNNPYGRLWVCKLYNKRYDEYTWAICSMGSKGCENLPNHTEFHCSIL